MAFDTYRVLEYVCDHPECEIKFVVEDRGGKTGQQPRGTFVGSAAFHDEEGIYKRVNWVACNYGHIAGATFAVIKENLGN
jgi:hypothetical protein